MIKRGIFITDTHWQQDVPLHPAYLAVKSFAKYFKPDIVVHGGDVGEWEFLMSINEKKLKLINGKTYMREYDTINRELDFWKEVAKDKLYLLLGNHDERIYKAIEKNPMLEGLVEWENRVDLKGVKFYRWRQPEQPVRIGVPYFAHGWYTNLYHAKKHLEAFSGNIIYGHVHKFQQASKILHAQNKQIQAWSVGCLRDLNPSFIVGPNEWQHGFGIFYLNGMESFNFYPINIIDGRFMTLEGELWDYRKVRKYAA